MTLTRFLRLYLPVLVLAAIAPLLALRFGGYHVRTFGWVSLGLVIWASVQAARGRASAPRSVAGIASFALIALTIWSGLSLTWVDFSRHDAWVETARTAGYAAAFLLGGTLLANARSFARFAAWSGFGIALVGAGTLARIITATYPLTSFVAGRLDWPIGYAPALAALYLIGMLLLLGVACACERTWNATRSRGQLMLGGLALAGATLCASLAYIGQTRGTLPALLVAVIVALVVTPFRLAWFLRFTSIALTLAIIHRPLGALYHTQFELKQAPFTKGANADQLLLTAQDAATHAAFIIVIAAVVLGFVGAALVPLGIRLATGYAQLTARVGRRMVLGTVLFVVAVVGTLGLMANHRSPAQWAANQVENCVHPSEAPNDPGSSVSHFANAGTGRCDYYRVALHAFAKHPVVGLGAGNFRGEYVRERTTGEEPRQTHSLPLALLAELGIVGGLLGALVLGAVLVATSRFVRSGPARDPAFAGAIAAIGYWVAHASIDWLWQVPAVTIPPLVLAGGLVACVSPGQQRVKAAVGAPIAAGVVLVALALILPVTLADAKLRHARDPQLQAKQAIQAAQSAQDLDGTWAEPAITEGALEASVGNKAAAAAAGRRAVALEPRNWSVQYRASGLIGLEDLTAGRAAFLAARKLNPDIPAVVAKPKTTASPDSVQDPNS